MGAVNPEDLGPGGGGREAGSSEHGVGTRPQICVKHFSVLLWESLPRSLAAFSSACSCVHACVESPSAGHA